MELAIGLILLYFFFLIWMTVLTYKVIKTKLKNRQLQFDNIQLQSSNEHLRDQNSMLRRYIEIKIHGKESEETKGAKET
jgi:cell division protein FtsB